MILLLDNYDSFTYNLVDYFNQLGITVKVFRNSDPLEEITAYAYQGIVLSPGPERPSSAGNLMKIITHYDGKLPLLGICLGHQAIGEYCGASLEKAAYPMHGKVSRVKTSSGILFRDIPDEIAVVRYHSLVLRNLPEMLKPVAFAGNNELMAFESTTGKMMGIQFHPEAVLTEYGLEMLKNWASFSNIV
ncbi:MAG: aminodeoxychorismate/anthranilate synthase component II [Roseivirga sp.]